MAVVAKLVMHDAARSFARKFSDPVVISTIVLITAACCLPLTRGFHPAQLIFIAYASAVILPAALWARQTSADLGFARYRSFCVTLLGWSIPAAFCDLGVLLITCFVEPERKLWRSPYGVLLFVYAAVVLFLAVRLELRRRRVNATRATEPTPP